MVEPRRLGGYLILGLLGEGGMGTVHAAWHPGLDRDFALKLPQPELLNSPEGLAMFRNEVQTLASFDHPNIARVHSGGIEDGQPYLAMELLEGGALADDEHRERFRNPRAALTLMLKIARAVQYAQDRRILHCDLKAANILFDDEAEPHVSDFGIALKVGRDGDSKVTSRGGTTGWMAPEQGPPPVTTEPSPRDTLTLAADVFSLGVMLHWLLTGALPFGDGKDYLEQVARGPLVPPRGWIRGLRWELRTIAWKAMQARPDSRYESAAALVHDLENARDCRPIDGERDLPLRRTSKWIRRHPLATAGGLQVLLLLVYVALTPFSVLREVRSTIRAQNGAAVVFQAGNVMNELRVFAARLEALAVDPAIRTLVNHCDVYTPPPALARGISGFDNVSVFKLKAPPPMNGPSRGPPGPRASGTLCVRYPRPPKIYGNLDFSFRNYFRTLEQLTDRTPGAPPKAYVSRAFFSGTDGNLHIGFSAPLFDEHDRPVGVLLATALARATFGAVQMNCSGHGDCMTALLGSRDRGGPDEELPDTVNVVAEPGLAEGQDKVLDRVTSRVICRALGCIPLPPGKQFSPPTKPQPLFIDHYEDPLSRAPSITALAAVGGTGLVVLVATPDSAADALTRRMIDRVKDYLWIPIVPGLLLLAALIVGRAFASRRERGSSPH